MTQQNEGSDALIHLRVPASTKARWVRESRSRGMKLTDWIVGRVERKMQITKNMSLEDLAWHIDPNGSDVPAHVLSRVRAELNDPKYSEFGWVAVDDIEDVDWVMILAAAGYQK